MEQILIYNVTRERKTKIWRDYFFVAALAFLIFLPWVHSYFVGDDWMMLARNSGEMLPEQLRQISDASNSRWYRPLFELTLSWTWRFFKLNPVGYHLINISLYALNAILVTWLGHHLAQDRRVGLLAGLIFATHCCHAEPVIWIAAGHEILAATAALFSLLLYIRFRESRRWGWWWGSVLLYVIGLGFKETILALPLLLICYDFIFTFSLSQPKVPWPKVWQIDKWKLSAKELLPLLPAALGGLAYLVYRLQVGGGYEMSFNVISVFKNVGYYLLMEIVALPVSTHLLARFSLWTWPVMAVLGVTCSFCVVLAKKQMVENRTIWFGGIWMVCALAPVSLIVTERTTYFSSVGWAWGIASVLVLAWDALVEKRLDVDRPSSKKRLVTKFLPIARDFDGFYPKLKQKLVVLSIVAILGANTVALSHRNYWWYRVGTISQDVFSQVQESLEASPSGEDVQFLFFNFPYRIEYAYAFGDRVLFATWLLQSQLGSQTEGQAQVFQNVTIEVPLRVHLDHWLSTQAVDAPVIAFYWQGGDILRFNVPSKRSGSDG